MERLRIKGAAELYSICEGFVKALNSKLVSPAIVIDPSEYYSRNFTDSGPNIFQINLRGRLLQIGARREVEPHAPDGLRERAELIGGNLEVWSQRQSGTEVELKIRAAIAYAGSSSRRRSLLLTKMPSVKKKRTSL